VLYRDAPKIVSMTSCTLLVKSTQFEVLNQSNECDFSRLLTDNVFVIQLYIIPQLA
jgi:hypothetical protein